MTVHFSIRWSDGGKWHGTQRIDTTPGKHTCSWDRTVMWNAQPHTLGSAGWSSWMLVTHTYATPRLRLSCAEWIGILTGRFPARIEPHYKRSGWLGCHLALDAKVKMVWNNSTHLEDNEPKWKPVGSGFHSPWHVQSCGLGVFHAWFGFGCRNTDHSSRCVGLCSSFLLFRVVLTADLSHPRTFQ